MTNVERNSTDGKTTTMFDAVKVFSATKQKDRDELGETVSRWLQQKRGEIQIVDKVVSQSSDSEYHCVTITLFYDFR